MRSPDVQLGGQHALNLMVAGCTARYNHRVVAAARNLTRWTLRVARIQARSNSHGPQKEGKMDTTTLLIIILLVLLLGGGGWYGRGRWY